jgi:UDP-glucuronate 4-epimerase
VSRFLVTGCAGFIGSHLSAALLNAGHEVVGVDAFTDYYPRALKERNLEEASALTAFSLFETDLADGEVEPLLDGVDGVYHLAAQPGVRGSWGKTFSIYVRDNVVATQRLMEAAAAGGARVVLASSSSIYGNAEAHPTPEDARPAPISPYGVTKLCCEQLAGAYAASLSLDFVALRYFTVYGPGQRPDMAFTRILEALRDGTSFEVFGTGEQSRDVTFVADAVSATIAAMERAAAGATYNVGGGTEASLRDVIALAERLTGRELDTQFSATAAGDVRRTAADTTRIRMELGWNPQTELEDGLRAQIAWVDQAFEAV